MEVPRSDGKIRTPSKTGPKEDFKMEYCQRLIDFMSRGYSLSAFAAEVGKTRKCLHDWLALYPDFNEAYKLGQSQSQRFWETMLVSAATGIIPEQLKKRGANTPNVTAIMFALRTRFYKDYSLKHQVEHSARQSSGSSLLVEFVNAASSNIAQEDDSIPSTARALNEDSTS